MSRTDTLSSYRTIISDRTVQYASTIIVEWTDERVTLNSGGWRTVTTKRKMNQASRQFNLGFAVSQRKGVWYLSLWNARTESYGPECPFEDHMSFDRKPWVFNGKTIEHRA